MQINNYLSDKLKAVIQALLQNKEFAGTINEPYYFTPTWGDVNGISIFGKNEWEQINSLSAKELFTLHLLPNLSTVNMIFLNNIGNILISDFYQKQFHRLIDYSTKNSILIVPVRNEISKFKAIDNIMVILLSECSNKSLMNYGITPVEQLLFNLAHELGHGLLHIHYSANDKTRERQSHDYIIFNEAMAWHVADDLMTKYCTEFNRHKFNKQKKYSIAAYHRSYSSKSDVRIFG